jgi:serine/threonine protein kinase
MLSIKEIANIAQQMFYGLLECHNKRIIYRNLKPSNIIIDNNKIKLINF